MKKRVLIVHGWDASPQANWFPWLKAELEAKNFVVDVPAMPNPATPNPAEWLNKLNDVAGELNENVFFVGHSLGCIAIAIFLQVFGRARRVGGCLFVAGFSGNIQNPATKEFYQTDLDVEKVKQCTDNMTAIFSEDDPMVSIDRARKFAEELGARSVVVNGMGHFVGSKGFTQLPLAFEELLALVSHAKSA